MAEKSTFGLKREQLAELLSLALDEASTSDTACSDQAIAELLRTQFSAQLPKGSFPSDSLLIMMGRMGFDVSSLGGLSHTLTSEARKAIATTIYYAAIAGALLYHDKKITAYSYQELGKSLSRLAGKEWMTPELTEMFSHARNVCKDRQEDK